MEPTTNNTATSDREIVLTRVFDAPRSLVFEAWTNPEHLIEWWGPRGFTNTFHQADVRVGGEWRFTMHGPDGTDYENLIVYEEISPLDCIAYRHGSDGADASPDMDVVVTFEEVGDRTRVELRIVVPSREDRDNLLNFGAVEGGQQTLDRLQDKLIRMAAATPVEAGFCITRTFNAPRELMFKVWSEAEHLGHWWGPKETELHIERFDFRVGGMFLYRLTVPDGGEMWGRFIYDEIDEPERMVYTSAFADSDGNAVRAPFSDQWPMEMLNTVTFSEQDGRTTVLVHTWAKNASPEEVQLFTSMAPSMTQGFTGTFDQLESYLAEL